MATNELYGKQARLVDLVAVQPGAVVEQDADRTPDGDCHVVCV